MKKNITLKTDLHREEAMAILEKLPVDGTFMVAFKETSIRNIEQNNLMWSLLHEISQQVEWYGQKLTPENWKDVFTAALKRSKVVPGIDGGFVVIGAHTSTMTTREMAELIELMQAFGAEHHVKFKANRGE